MESIILTAVYLIVIFTVLVAVHEFGHMWVAKRSGMKVDEFAIGMGPILVRLYQGRDGTLYTLRALPIGGFVRIAGMMPDEEHVEGGFQSKPLSARFLTVLAGPIASILFGILLLTIIGATAGLPSGKTTPQVRFVMPDSPAQEAGLRIGDVLVAINGEPIETTEQAGKVIRANPGKPLDFTFRRKGETFSVTIVPRLEEEPVLPSSEEGTTAVQGDGESPKTVKVGRIGVVWRTERQPEPVGTAFLHALRYSVAIVVGIVDSLRRLLFGQGNIHEVGSLISIASATSATAQLGFVEVADFAAAFSIMLGVINLLPIPILDGGYLMLFTIEAIRRRKLTPETMARAQLAGLVIVLAIFLTVFSLDIYKLLTGKLIR